MQAVHRLEQGRATLSISRGRIAHLKFMPTTNLPSCLVVMGQKDDSVLPQ